MEKQQLAAAESHKTELKDSKKGETPAPEDNQASRNLEDMKNQTLQSSQARIEDVATAHGTLNQHLGDEGTLSASGKMLVGGNQQTLDAMSLKNGPGGTIPIQEEEVENELPVQ